MADCFEEDVKFRRRWILDQRFVDWLLRKIVELDTGQCDQTFSWYMCAPRQRPNSLGILHSCLKR